MKKVLLACLGAFCLLTASAFADEGLPSTSVLDDMGLSGMQILSDDSALAVRGMGWQQALLGLVPKSKHGSIAIAGGLSNAEIESGYRRRVTGEAETHNFYLLIGQHKVHGYNDSYAGRERTRKRIHTVSGYDGYNDVTKRIRGKSYYAGGSSGGYAF